MGLSAALAAPFLAAGCDPGAETPEGIESASNNLAAALSANPNTKAVCGTPGAGTVHCHSVVRVGANGTATPMATASGLSPADLRAAYRIPAGGAGVTVAIVDAYDNPNAEADLAVYRQNYGLPACTTANGCFKKVNQNGQSSPLPKGDASWGAEIALDVQMVSAACPSCKILLVETNSNSFADLGTGVNAAVTLGAKIVSNSYGGSEFSTQGNYDKYYNRTGVLMTVSSGDSGYGVEYPASSQYVLAVGGTSLTKSTTAARGWVETAWSGAGSGCSAYSAKPTWQTDKATCAKRTVADISAVADPSTGVAVYDSYQYPGWITLGGTSVSAPLVAGAMAVLGSSSWSPSWPYAHAAAFYDITSGSNGTCTQKYLCQAGSGYDGPTGLGTPNTIAGIGFGVCGYGEPGCTRRPLKLHRMSLTCKGALVSNESIVDLSTGYSNYTCANRWKEQCIDDGSFDGYYMEWCDFATPTCVSRGTKQYACDPGAVPAGTCKATVLHRTGYGCDGTLKTPESTVDLTTGYGNYTCGNRFKEQCVQDGTWDGYYSEWCEYTCS